MPSVWFITGCSTGFGRLLAEQLLADGETVVATARNPTSLLTLGHDSDRLLVLPLDVTDVASIAEAVKGALDRFGRIDVLVNNAGYGYFAPAETANIERVRAMFETNVIGLAAVTAQVLPGMRERGSGCIVNLSSVAGKIATPRGGFYQGSKWAVEAMSEALYLETNGFGLRVVVVEPGSFSTNFSQRANDESDGSTPEESAYAMMVPRWRMQAARHVFNAGSGNPDAVVTALLDAVRSGRPFVRVPVGQDAINAIARRAELGDERWVEWMREVYGGSEEKKEERG